MEMTWHDLPRWPSRPINTGRSAVSSSGPRRRRMESQANVPKGYHTVTPYLVVEGVPGLIEFLKTAFGATERMRNLRPDGTVSHAEVEIGDSVVMMGEPQEAGSAMPGMIHLFVADADATY